MPKMFDTQIYKLKTSSEPVSIGNAADVFFTYSEKSDKKLCYDKSLAFYMD